MQLNELIAWSETPKITIEQVRYARSGQAVEVLLSSEAVVTGEARQKICRLLTERFQFPVQVSYRTVQTQQVYDAPVLVKRQSKPEKSAAADVPEDGFCIGRFNRTDDEKYYPLCEIKLELGQAVTAGRIRELNIVSTKKNFIIVSFDLEDFDGGALSCKGIYNLKQQKQIEACLKDDIDVLVKGKLQFDSFARTNIFMLDAIRATCLEETIDTARDKRIELAVHTQMSNMEGLIDPKRIGKFLSKWGHEAVGITDRGSVQAYPLVYDALKKTDIKLIFGYDAKLLNPEHRILTNIHELELTPMIGNYTVFDIETTGFSRFNDRIIEIGATRYRDGELVGTFSEFVYPERLLPEKIIELTHITDSMLMGAPKIEAVLPKFLEFSSGSILVAHNADFDIGFITENAFRLGLDFKPVYIDTLGLARCLHPEYHNHKLDTITKKLNISLINHHRAIDDATATGLAFLKLMAEWQALGLPFEAINRTPSEFPLSRHESYDAFIYAKKQHPGLINLYGLISDANMKHFFKSPGVPYDEFEAHREGLVIGTGFVGSELFNAISRRYPQQILEQIAAKYDLLFVQPPSYTEKALLTESVGDEADFRHIVEQIVALGEQLNIPVVATGTPHYLKKSERTARNILVNYQRPIEFENNERYRFLTTDEMLHEFAWLGSTMANALVIDNPKAFIASFDRVIPVPEGTFTPNLEGAEEELDRMAWAKAKSIYGDPLPEIVHARLDRELKSIINNGYASLYVIAQRLVKKSNEDGYLVGSRGSVGSSFAATMADITEVNPLLPHYVCPECRYSEFVEDGSVDSGFDLPPKACPHCGSKLKRDGHNIPFEVFLGFDGDKEPDIDLNFAGVYMPTIHKYTEMLFGEGKVFRAGTISGVQTKTAFGFIRKYLEQPYIPAEDRNMSEARIRALQRIMEGTKRTTGQHAGGLMIVPQQMSILEFCPIQYPADDLNSEVITTHFSYKNLSGRMLKLDELGHTSPTIIRELQEMTGIDPLGIEFDDEPTLSIFTSTDALNAKFPYSNSDDGSLGIPEFGTNFVRGMLKDTAPKTISELTRISGLSHGTDVWLNNAQDLVRNGITDLSHSICTRDDIMTYLIQKKLDPLMSFKIMEAVRKGKGIPEGMDKVMREHDVPQWYIDSCNKIQYMFPKAHAAAYVMMSYRIAWFKVHSPAAFYATYYTQRLSDFSTAYLFKDLDQVQHYMQDLKTGEAEGIEIDANKWTLLEMIEEMYARGFKFVKVDLYNSLAATFTITDAVSILPPLAALDDVSEAMGESILAVRSEGEFISREDFKARAGLTKNAMISLDDFGVLDDLPQSNQISFLI